MSADLRLCIEIAKLQTDPAVELHRHGFVWTHGDRFRYRTWLGLRLLDPEAARLYFNTTREGGPDRAR